MDKEYGKLSTMLYEFTKPVGYSIEGDIEYYSKKLSMISGRVLEAGVGTGRMLVPLAQKGLTIDGVDSSKEMLAQCQKNVEKYEIKTQLYEQDLVGLSLPDKYDAIIMPTGSFCLLPKEKIQQVLKTFYDHLNVGGRLIIDLEMPMTFKEGATSISNFSIDETKGISFTSYSEKIDWIHQKVSYINRYELIENGKVMETEISTFVLFWYGVVEFQLLLSSLNYKEINFEIGYGNPSSDIVTFTAYK